MPKNLDSRNRRTLYAPLWLHHVPEFKLNLRIYRFHVLVQSIQQGNACRNRHALDVLVADAIDVLDQRSDRIGVRDDNDFVPSTNAGCDDGIKERHDSVRRIFQRFRT